MAHRTWKETKQQPIMLPGQAVPGCSFISFHFLWAILCTQTLPNLLLFVSLAHGSDLANQEISALKTKLKAMFQEIQKKSANDIPQQQAPPLPGRMNIQGDPSGGEPKLG